MFRSVLASALPHRGCSWEPSSGAEGAQTAIHLASAPELKGITGKYFIKSQENPSSKAYHDERLARELWDVSARLTGLEVASTRAA